MNPSYLQSLACFQSFRLTLKRIACPHCRGVGALIRHGFLRGYGEGSRRIQRGWRIFCSNRQLRRGCGHTHALLLADYLYRRSVTAGTLTGFLKNLLSGLSLHAAWPMCPQGVECGLRLWRTWKCSQTRLRSLLCPVAPVPASLQTNPLLQTLEHLLGLFPSVQDFHLRLQKSLL